MSQELEYVINLLKASVSHEESVRNEALNRIVELERNAFFLITLWDIATCNDNDLSKLSSIILKNCVCKILSASNKAENSEYRNVLNEIKPKILQVYSIKYENNANRIHKHFCILVRTIARHEFPLNWKELYDKLLNGLSLVTNELNINAFNLIFLLYHILKERISMRLYKDRAMSNQIIESFFPSISKFWTFQLNSLNSSTQSVDCSIYLDCIILNSFCYNFREVYKNEELLSILRNLVQKFVNLVQLYKVSRDERVKKNVVRVIRGFSVLIEREPHSIVFIDFSPFLSVIFDLTVNKSGDGLDNESMKLLVVIFSSNSMNNEKYFSIYFNQLESIPTVKTNVTPINSPKKVDLIDLNSVSYYTNYSSLINSNGGKKGVEIEDLMDRQLTFLFYKSLRDRGGFLNFLDLLRVKYLKLDLSVFNEWNEDEFPSSSPSFNLVPDLISCMNLKLVDFFNSVYNTLFNCDLTDFFDYDTYLQFYTLCFKDFYDFHSYKHYSNLLAVFARVIEFTVLQYQKLAIFRVSRIVNLWCKKRLIGSDTKSEILDFLAMSLLSNSDQLKLQHVIPLYNLYENSKDENIWLKLFKKVDLSQIVEQLTVEEPVIRIKSLELICNLCLEYDETGQNLSNILSLYNQFSTVNICEAVLNTIFHFITTLDWVKCYSKDDLLNPNFVNFVTQVINSTTNLHSNNDVSIAKYALVDELLVGLWLSLLRILPFDVRGLDLSQLFANFTNLVDFLGGHPFSNTLCDDLCLKVVIEYVLIVNNIVEHDNVCNDTVLKTNFTTLNVNKLNELNHTNEMIVSMLNTFGIKNYNYTQIYQLLDKFFSLLETIQDDKSTHFSALTMANKSTNFYPTRINRESLKSIESLLAAINQIVLNTAFLTSYFKTKEINGLEFWVNEQLIKLVNLANLFRNDPFVQMGLTLFSCSVVSTVPEIAFKFVKFNRVNQGSDAFDLGWNNTQIHKQHEGIFIISYFLRILSQISSNYKPKFVSISTEKVESHTIPPSNRFEYVKNKSLVNVSSYNQSSHLHRILENVMKSMIDCLKKMDRIYSTMLMDDINSLNDEVKGILTQSII